MIYVRPHNVWLEDDNMLVDPTSRDITLLDLALRVIDDDEMRKTLGYRVRALVNVGRIWKTLEQAHAVANKRGAENLLRQIDELLVVDAIDSPTWPAEALDAIEAAGLTITLPGDE